MPRKSRTTVALLIAAACIAALALAGCQRKGIEELVSDELFQISLGKMEDQVDLFQFENAMVERSNTVYMRDGWFYIANGSAGKIMVFTSYGDLIFLLYNPQTNPAPTTLGPAVPSNGTDEASTRGFVAYPFADIGKIAVASDRTLYVEDAVSDARTVKDTEHGVLLSRVILRFDRKGRQLGYIGQEGIGGTPFPFVFSLSVTANDQLVVVCRYPDGLWKVFWYSRDGVPLYQVEIGDKNLPFRAQKGTRAVLTNIVADQQSPALYLVIYTYRDSVETSSSAASSAGGSSPATLSAAGDVVSRAYRLDLHSQQYSSRFVEFPQNPPHREKEGLKTTEIPSPPSDLLGVSAGGYFYLLAYTDTNLYTLQILDTSGRVRARRHVVIEDSGLAFRDLHLSPTGILYGILADRTAAHISWWRSDLLLKGE
ncbi:MAG TPA: hypothetical protein VHE79_06705 [Spirochaetia bacterium]